MKTVNVYGRTIQIPEGSANDRIQETTPQSHFLRNHWSDIVKEAGALLAVGHYIGSQSTETYAGPGLMVDGMAGCGFSAAVLKGLFMFPLSLNDLNEECRDILRLNYPEETVTGEDITTYTPPDAFLSFLDFNTFTLQHIDRWRTAFTRFGERSRWLLLTDSACYGFRFGNLSRYGCATREDYYKALSKALRPITGKSIQAVCDFGNAAVIALSTDRMKVRMIDPMDASVRKVEGFGL